MTTLAPYPVQRFVDNSGNSLVGGKLYTWAAGTTTPIATYSDSVGTTNTNPVILNARGECNLWLNPNTNYKLQLQDSAGNVIWTVDNIVNSQLLTLFGGVDTGAVNAYVVNFTANFTTLTNGIIVYFIASNSNTGASTLNVNNLGVVPIINQAGSALASYQILSGQVTGVVYYNGNWLILQPGTGVVAYGGTDTGVANAYVVALTGQYFSYVAGNVLYFIPAHTNTGASTINVKGLGAKSIYGLGGTNFPAEQLPAGGLVQLLYDGTYFQIVSPQYVTGTFTCPLTGGTTSPNLTFYYSYTPTQVTLYWSGASVTSNSTGFGCSGFPVFLRGVTTGVQSPLIAATDNGALGVAMSISIANQIGSNNLVFSINNASGNWTNSGLKSISAGSFSYPLL